MVSWLSLAIPPADRSLSQHCAEPFKYVTSFGPPSHSVKSGRHSATSHVRDLSSGSCVNLPGVHTGGRGAERGFDPRSQCTGWEPVATPRRVGVPSRVRRVGLMLEHQIGERRSSHFSKYRCPHGVNRFYLYTWVQAADSAWEPRPLTPGLVFPLGVTNVSFRVCSLGTWGLQVKHVGPLTKGQKLPGSPC